MHRPADGVSVGPRTRRSAATYVVIEDDDAVGPQGGLDDLGAFGVVALAYVMVVIEAPYPRRPMPERPTVLIEPQHLAAAQVADLYRAAYEARRLRFGTGRRRDRRPTGLCLSSRQAIPALPSSATGNSCTAKQLPAAG